MAGLLSPKEIPPTGQQATAILSGLERHSYLFVSTNFPSWWCLAGLSMIMGSAPVHGAGCRGQGRRHVPGMKSRRPGPLCGPPAAEGLRLCSVRLALAPVGKMYCERQRKKMQMKRWLPFREDSGLRNYSCVSCVRMDVSCVCNRTPCEPLVSCTPVWGAASQRGHGPSPLGGAAQCQRQVSRPGPALTHPLATSMAFDTGTCPRISGQSKFPHWKDTGGSRRCDLLSASRPDSLQFPVG
uniref:Uncharacterized protein n=1 Tax=Rousettus aegyptiacus TaxID=9407 RepID=A0A7J8F017_ROUAE|nr:hypothetical protein HJG63_012232 [Rousettus aegyptiacus]